MIYINTQPKHIISPYIPAGDNPAQKNQANACNISTADKLATLARIVNANIYPGLSGLGNIWT
jgi:hypothetical protein